MSGIRINELRLAGLPGSDKTYGASFRTKDGGGFRPLSVIAGPSLTGKTTIIDFIAYCLGGSTHPQKDEIRDAVRSALLEAELDGSPTVIERSATGEPSKFALVWEGDSLETITGNQSDRYQVEPTTDPEGFSQYLLTTFSLDNVLLPDSEVKDETATRLLSIRDVFDVMFIPNERLDNKSLVFELGNYAKRQKFRRTVDAIFGIHDNQDAILQRRYSNAREEAGNAKARANALRLFAEEEHPRGIAVLTTDLAQADAAVADLSQQLELLDSQQSANASASGDLRAQLTTAETAARDARIRVRDRISLLERLDALRAQYADDQRKLTFLFDAERLFDPLHVTTCPVCFNDLVPLPTVENDTCSLCHSLVPPVISSDVTEATAAEGTGESTTTPAALESARPVLEAELRNITKRLKSLNEYTTRLRVHLAVLEQEKTEAQATANAALHLGSPPGTGSRSESQTHNSLPRPQRPESRSGNEWSVQTRPTAGSTKWRRRSRRNGRRNVNAPIEARSSRLFLDVSLRFSPPSVTRNSQTR
jgi:DNA repair exonuclease SbcCD ATPase subunit